MKFAPILKVSENIADGPSMFDSQRIYYATGDIEGANFLEGKPVTYHGRPSRANLIARPGDILFAKMKETNKVVYIDSGVENAIFSTGFFNLRAKVGELDSRYLFWFLHSPYFHNEKDRRCTGSTQKGLTLSKLEEIKIPLPSRMVEQRRIATILDHKTAHIDQIIAKTERSIELLHEFRSTLITAAVENRIAVPGAGKKGNVEVIQIRHLATIKNSNVDKHTVSDEIPVRLCNCVDVYNNHLITDDMEFMSASATPSEISAFKLNAGDVLLAKDSVNPDNIGIPAYVPESISNVVCGYNLSILRSKDLVRPDFLFWALQTKRAKEAFLVTANGVTFSHVTLEGIKRIPVRCPSLEEQKAVADFLNEKTKLVDLLTERKEALISMMSEYRSSLITAAMKGRLIPSRSSPRTNHNVRSNKNKFGSPSMPTHPELSET